MPHRPGTTRVLRSYCLSQQILSGTQQQITFGYFFLDIYLLMQTTLQSYNYLDKKIKNEILKNKIKSNLTSFFTMGSMLGGIIFDLDSFLDLLPNT